MKQEDDTTGIMAALDRAASYEQASAALARAAAALASRATALAELARDVRAGVAEYRRTAGGGRRG